MSALTSYHNIWMMNQAASKSVVLLLTQGFLPSPCPFGPEGGTERREKGFVQPCCLFVMRSAVYLVSYNFYFDASTITILFFFFFLTSCLFLLRVYFKPWITVLALTKWTVWERTSTGRRWPLKYQSKRCSLNIFIFISCFRKIC